MGALLLGTLTGCDDTSEAKIETKKHSSILDKIRESTEEALPKAESNVQSQSAHVASVVAADPKRGLVRRNVPTDFNPDLESPTINPTTWVDPLSSVIGNVEIGHRVYIAPFSSVRGDEGQPIHIGNESNLQDGVVVHALEKE